MLKRTTPLRAKKPWRRKPRTDRGCSLEVEQGPSKPSARVRAPAAPPRKKTSSGRTKRTPGRADARGRPCLIRLPGCQHYVEDGVVLAHFRTIEFCGGGMKPPDWMGAYGCGSCHDIVDGRKPRPEGYTYEAIRLAHLMGVVRRLALLGMSDEILAQLIKA